MTRRRGRQGAAKTGKQCNGMLEMATADREGEAITRDVSKSKVKEKEEPMAREES